MWRRGFAPPHRLCASLPALTPKELCSALEVPALVGEGRDRTGGVFGATPAGEPVYTCLSVYDTLVGDPRPRWYWLVC